MGILLSPTPEPTHHFQAGGLVCIKRIPTWTLEPASKGPYQFVHTTPTAVKVGSVIPWIYHSQLKKATMDVD